MFFKLFMIPLAFFCAVIVFFPNTEASTGICKGSAVFSATINKDSKRLSVSPKDEEAFSSFKSCVEYLSTRPAGKKLVDLVNQLLEIYFLFEKQGILKINEGDPLFTGLNSGSPVIKKSGNERVFIKPKQEKQEIPPLLSKVLTLEGLKPDEDGYYPLKVIGYSKLSDSEINSEDELINNILIYKEKIINNEKFTQIFDVDIRNGKTEKRPPTLALTFPKNVQPEDDQQ